MIGKTAVFVFILSFLSVGPMPEAYGGQIKVGDKAPDFSLTGSDGKLYKLSQFKGKLVVLEWFNKDCPFVHKFYDANVMQALQKKEVGDGVIWLTINSSAEGKEGYMKVEEAEKVRQGKKMSSTALLLDPKGRVGTLYSAKTTPHMFVINKQGILSYQGAIDDRPSAQPESLEGAQNYVMAVLESLKKGETIKLSSTAPYGCGVKY